MRRSATLQDDWCPGLFCGWRGVVVGACIGAAFLDVAGPILVRVAILLLPGIAIP